MGGHTDSVTNVRHPAIYMLYVLRLADDQGKASAAGIMCVLHHISFGLWPTHNKDWGILSFFVDII